MNFKPLIYIIILLTLMSSIRVFDVSVPVPPIERPLIEDANGFAYIQDSDSYFFYHKTMDHDLDNGLSWFAYHWHNFLSLFGDISLMGSMGLISFLFFGLTILNIFFIIYTISRSYEASFFGGLLLVINPVFFGSVMNADTNALIYYLVTNIVLFFVLLLQEDFEDFVINFLFRGLFVFLLGLNLIFFKFVWDGWYFMIIVICLSLIPYIILKNTKRIMEWVAVVVGGIVFFVLLYDYWPFKGYIFSSVKHEIGYHTINELQEYGFMILFLVDNFVFVVAAILFSIYLMCRKRDFVSCFLCSWFVLMLYASSQAFRFVYFAILVYCIIGGLMLWELFKIISTLDNRYLLMRRVAIIFFSILFIALLFTVDWGEREVLVTDAEYSLNFVSIPDDANILTHWDSGHMIGAFVDRDLLFKSSPSALNIRFKELLVGDNESLLIDEFSRWGDNIYIILTEHDYKVINYQYHIREGGILSNLMMDESDSFELYYRAWNRFSWVRVWRLKDGSA